MTRILLIIGASRRPGKEPLEASIQEFSKLYPGKWNSSFILALQLYTLWTLNYCLFRIELPCHPLWSWLWIPIIPLTFEVPFSCDITLHPHDYTPIVPWWIMRTWYPTLNWIISFGTLILITSFTFERSLVFWKHPCL